MKKNILFIAWIAIFSLTASNSQAQSLKDLLNKDNISKVVNAITGTPETIDMTGTWTYSGSAVEFESDNLLMKAGGAAAATMDNRHPFIIDQLIIRPGYFGFFFHFRCEFYILSFFFLASVYSQIFCYSQAICLYRSELCPLFTFIPHSNHRILNNILCFGPVESDSECQTKEFILQWQYVVSEADFLHLY